MTRAILLSIPVLLLACRADNTLKTFNAEPSAEITSHSDGDEVLEGYTESFRGAVSDPDHAAEDLTATWYLDGEIVCESAAPGTDGISTCDVVIPADASEITLEVQDPDNAAGSDQVSLSVVPTESPEAELTAPTEDGVYYSDQLITFSGIVSDGEDDMTMLSVSWESSLDGALDVEAVPNDDGEFTGFSYLAEGEHAVELNVSDTTGKTGSDSVIVTVGPPNTAPGCQITAPADEGSGESGETVQFEAAVDDADVPADWLAVTWESDKDGVLGESNPDSTGAVVFLYSDLSVDSHVITLSVADEVGATCSDFIIYTVGTPPSLSIDSPTSGDVVDEGDSVSFLATVSDNEDVSTDLAMSWVSDIDGEFSTQGADSTGLVSFSETGLSTGTHAITATVTDTDGLYATAVVSLQINSLPTAPGVELTPDPADTTDDLVVSILTSSTDADGDPISYSYAWTEDGVSSSASTSSTLAASETAKGQTWAVTVTPNDGYSDGPSGSAELTIGNTVPEITSVVIDPDPAYPDDELSCSWSFYDEDGDDDASTLEWTIDGVSVGTATTLSGVFSANDEVSCTVTAHDGDDAGTSDSASITITNTPPEVTEVTLSPSEVYTHDSITASVSTDDAEGDSVSVSYEWYVDGSLVGETGTSLDGATYFDKDQEVYVVVTPSDAYEDGAAISSDSIVVSNTPPEAPEVSISPEVPVEGEDDVLCIIDSESTDEDGDAVSYTVSWEVDGTTYTDATTTDETGDTVPAADIAGGEEWTCTVTPSDGDDDGATATASVIVDGTVCWSQVASYPLSTSGSGVSTLNGGWGGHSYTTVDGVGCLKQTSDWNYAYVPFGGLTTPQAAVQIDVYYPGTSSTSATMFAVGDKTGYNYVENTMWLSHGTSSGTCSYTVGGGNTTGSGTTVDSGSCLIPTGVWTTVRWEFDTDDMTVDIYVDGVMELEDLPIDSIDWASGSSMILNSGGVAYSIAPNVCWANVVIEEGC